MSLYWWALGVSGALTLGWVLGMWTRKRSNGWCSACGATLTCAVCEQSRTRRVLVGRL